MSHGVYIKLSFQQFSEGVWAQSPQLDCTYWHVHGGVLEAGGLCVINYLMHLPIGPTKTLLLMHRIASYGIRTLLCHSWQSCASTVIAFQCAYWQLGHSGRTWHQDLRLDGRVQPCNDCKSGPPPNTDTAVVAFRCKYWQLGHSWCAWHWQLGLGGRAPLDLETSGKGGIHCIGSSNKVICIGQVDSKEHNRSLVVQQIAIKGNRLLIHCFQNLWWQFMVVTSNKNGEESGLRGRRVWEGEEPWGGQIGVNFKSINS